MRPPEGACRGCQRRTAECHASCEDYKRYKAELAAFNAELKAAKQPEQTANGYAIARHKRMKKRRNHREGS